MPTATTNVQALLIALRTLEDCENLIAEGMMSTSDSAYTAALAAVQALQTAAGNTPKATD